jgi:hypothetical protein
LAWRFKLQNHSTGQDALWDALAKHTLFSTYTKKYYILINNKILAFLSSFLIQMLNNYNVSKETKSSWS